MTSSVAQATVQGLRVAPQQRHLWLLGDDPDRLRSGGTIEVEGPLDPEPVRAALEAVGERHEALRTCFLGAPALKVPLQVIAEHGSVDWGFEDLGDPEPDEVTAAVTAVEERHAAQPFDLEEGPLLRATLLRISRRLHRLVLSMPALCADRPTLDVVAGELIDRLCGREPADEEPLQYADLSEWQHELLEDEEAEEGAAFWERFLEPARSCADLPFVRRPVPSDPGQPSAVEIPGWGARADRGVEKLAERLGTAPRTVVLAAWTTLLSRTTGSGAVPVCDTFDGRRYPELEEVVGLGSRCAPVVCEISPEWTFAECVAEVGLAREEAADWHEHYLWQDRAGVAEAEGRSQAARFSFEYDSVPPARGVGKLTWSWCRRGARIERHELRLVCTHDGDELHPVLEFDRRVLDGRSARRLAERLATLVNAAVERPETAVGRLPVVGPDERRNLLVERNATERELAAVTGVHDLFERRAERAPEAVAITADGAELTYGELDRGSSRLATRLRAEGVGPEVRVALLVDGAPEIVTAVLGVLRAGGAFVPLDPQHPLERSKLLMEECGARLVLAPERLGSLADEIRGAADLVLLDGGGEGGGPGANDAADAGEAAAPGPDHLAYVLHTSGSTGVPKGVGVAHRSLLNYVAWAVEEYPLDPGERVPLYTPMTFDLTLTSLFVPLLAGATVAVIPRDDRGVGTLARTLAGHREEDWGWLKITPSHLELLSWQLGELDTGPEAMPSTLIVGGEALFAEALEPWRRRAPQTRIVNEYGPTETVIGCCADSTRAGDLEDGPVPIGKPISNTRLYVLDPFLEPVPEGCPGELVVGGAGVTRGYLGRPGRTASSFVPDPFGSEPAARLYRTGDLVRYRDDGRLEHLGRVDRQVKIRGVRVELGEIEAVLITHPEVHDSAAVIQEYPPGEHRLAAYVATGQERPGSAELRDFLASRLPETLVPTTFVRMAELPLTAHGKVDLSALPAPSSERPDLDQDWSAPRDATEQILVEIWETVLGIEGVGVHDNFFSLGGDSIRSVRAVGLARQKGLEFTVEDLFRRPTPANLAEELKHLEPEELVDQVMDLSDEEVQRLLAEKRAAVGEE